MAFETEPTFRRFNVGAGVVRVHSSDEVIASTACQFASFGRSRFSGPSRLCSADPLEADQPLRRSLDGAVALVARGKCSFESKMRAAAAADASGVILMNDEDETFVAAPDPPSAGTAAAGAAAGASIPFAVVSSSAAAAIRTAYEEAERSGGDAGVSMTMLSSDPSLGDALRLPLFPVAQPFMPGQLLRMRVSRGERLALQTRFKLALDGPEGPLPEDIGTATVVVVFVGDASRNVRAPSIPSASRRRRRRRRTHGPTSPIPSHPIPSHPSHPIPSPRPDESHPIPSHPHGPTSPAVSPPQRGSSAAAAQRHRSDSVAPAQRQRSASSEASRSPSRTRASGTPPRRCSLPLAHSRTSTSTPSGAKALT